MRPPRARGRGHINACRCLAVGAAWVTQGSPRSSCTPRPTWSVRSTSAGGCGMPKGGWNGAPAPTPSRTSACRARLPRPSAAWSRGTPKGPSATALTWCSIPYPASGTQCPSGGWTRRGRFRGAFLRTTTRTRASRAWCCPPMTGARTWATPGSASWSSLDAHTRGRGFGWLPGAGCHSRCPLSAICTPKSSARCSTCPGTTASAPL